MQSSFGCRHLTSNLIRGTPEKTRRADFVRGTLKEALGNITTVNAVSSSFFGSPPLVALDPKTLRFVAENHPRIFQGGLHRNCGTSHHQRPKTHPGKYEGRSIQGAWSV